MEYGEAISAGAAELAFDIGRKEVAYGRRDLHEVAAEAVSDAYCVCVVAGQDAVAGGISAVHSSLIEDLEDRLRHWLQTGATN